MKIRFSFAVIIVILLVTIKLAQSQVSRYVNWLTTQLDDQIHSFPDSASISSPFTENFRYIPLKVAVNTDSDRDHCLPSEDRRYCPSSQSPVPVNLNTRPVEGSGLPETLPCLESYCVYSSCNFAAPKPLQDFQQDAYPLLTVTGYDMPLDEYIASGSCTGVTLSASELQYKLISDIPGREAELCPVEPLRATSIRLSPLSQTSYTISFMVEPHSGNGNYTFLNISSDYLQYSEFLFTVMADDGVISKSEINGRILDVPSIDALPKKGKFHIALVINDAGALIYHNGALRYRIDQSFDTRFIVSFGARGGRGEPRFAGIISDLAIYATLASDAEIYALSSGEPIPKPPYRPECECPRDLPDVFSEALIVGGDFPFYSLSKGFSNAMLCANGFNSTSTARTSLAATPQGIFSADGWISDFTDKATVAIQFPQDMLVYGMEFVLVNYPEKLEVYIRRDNSEPSLLIQVTDNCRVRYNKPVSIVDSFELRESIVPQRKKRSERGNQRVIKCYEWNQLVGRTWPLSVSYDYFGESEIEIEEDTSPSLILPFITKNELSRRLDNDFTGKQLELRLIGHYNATEANERWYAIGQMSIFARPHCGGEGFTFLRPQSFDLKGALEYFPITQAKFACFCPPGITGDRCETCADIEGLPRYKSSITDDCADCACSDLSESDICDKNTGQCPCSSADMIDVQLAGRQCHWYVAEVFPLYGPIAGGTRINITGGYFNSTLRVRSLDRRADFTITGQQIFSRLQINSSSYPFENQTVSLEISQISELDIGPPIRQYQFEYRPNPILENITPRRSTLSGGINMTVTGQFIDSVAVPEMIIYVRQGGVTRLELRTICTGVNGTAMICPTPDFAEADLPQIYLDSPAIVPTSTPPEPSPPSTTTEAVSRKKRQTDSNIPQGVNPDHYINGRKGFSFTFGFQFDGVTDYEDLEKNDEVAHLAELFVAFTDPKVTPFKVLPDGSRIKEYHPIDDSILLLDGESLTIGAGMEDYIIQIGVGGVCVLTDLSANQIACRPPAEEPDSSSNNSVKYKSRQIPNVRAIVGNTERSLGYIYYQSNIWNDDPGFRAGMITLMVLIPLVIIVIVVVLIFRRRRRRHEASIRGDGDGGDGTARYVKPKILINEELKARVNRCKIPRDNLHIQERLGKGNFGQVFKGQLLLPNQSMRTVAVKCLKDDQDMSVDDLENFLKEGTIMMDFRHENVLSLVGVVWEEGERPSVVLPYMENGDMQSLLKSPKMDFVLGDVLHFALQIANGMAYLEEERFVHRDLAARNCMVTGKFIVKIADFGLSRDIYETCYYVMEDRNKPIPVKWMSIEALKEGKFSSKSDVWSYGVTLWELLTRGQTPYPGVTNYEVRDYVEMGRRLDRPECCPPPIYEMMCKCWEAATSDRPTFSEISSFLTDILNSAGRDSTQPPAVGDHSEEYSYERSYTKDIPGNYETCEPDDLADCYIAEEDYLQPNAKSSRAENPYVNEFVKLT